jgi:hypothetical protein
VCANGYRYVTARPRFRWADNGLLPLRVVFVAVGRGMTREDHVSLRVWGTTLAVVGAVVAAAPAAGAEATGWKLDLLPLPEGHEDAIGYVTGIDGRGGYSGYLRIGDGAQVVTWTDGRPDLRGTPPGTEFARTDDQNWLGVVVGSAIDHDTGGFVPFALDAGGFRVLPLPDGQVDGFATAINERGDIVGGGTSGDVVLWPAGEEPRVLRVDLPLVSAADIDDDGTVLLNSDAGEYLWRDGALTRLADPAGHAYPHARAIKNGWVAGGAASTTEPGGTGFLWCRPEVPTTCQSPAPIPLPRGSTASEINSALLIVGRERSAAVSGPLAVWRGDRYLERLPVPTDRLGTAGALAEDGTIAGWVTSGDPSDGGQPAVWLPER